MKKSGAIALVSAVALLSTTAALAASSSPPPIHRVGDHWSAWNPPPAGPNDYIIVKGDTLWDLANRWFGDPFLWPQIWDENRYILDSHWIYPGDPLVRPGQPTVVPDSGALPGGDADKLAAMPDDDDALRRPAPSPLLPAATESELFCSGRVTEYPEPTVLEVVSSINERVGMGQGDVIYLSHGRDVGLRPGDQYTIVRPTYEVRHPSSKDSLGTMVRRLGRVRVLLVHETSATAAVDFACEDVLAGDRLVPWRAMPVPMLTGLPSFDPLDAEPSGGPTGHLVETRDGITAVGEGHIIFTDLGESSGVAPGDVLTLFRDPDDERLPRTMLGQAVVLAVDPRTSSARIVTSVRESYVGDRVEIAR